MTFMDLNALILQMLRDLHAHQQELARLFKARPHLVVGLQTNLRLSSTVRVGLVAELLHVGVEDRAPHLRAASFGFSSTVRQLAD